MYTFLFHFFFWAWQVQGLPVGHEAGVLGNTTARPAAVGSALQFPSNLAELEVEKTQLYSGLIYYGARTSQQGSDSTVESRFVPYFTGSNMELGDYKIITYGHYETDSKQNTSEVSIDSNQGQIFQSGSQFELGFGVGRSLTENWSLGINLSLQLNNEENHAYLLNQNQSGNSMLVTFRSQMEFVDLKSALSATYRRNRHWLSFSLLPARISISKSYKINWYSLTAEDGENVHQLNLSLNPEYANSWGAGLGWHFEGQRFQPTLEYFHYLYTGKKAAEVNQGTILFVANEDRFKFNGGLKVKMKDWSLLTGGQYGERHFHVNSILSKIRARSVSLGGEIHASQSKPVIGLYFSENTISGSKNILLGLLYSTHYSF